MNDIDEIVSQKGTEKQNTFDKQAWIEKKKAEKQEVYNLMDKTADEVFKDENVLLKYLDVQGRFDKYSVGNALVITALMPEATRLKDFNDWKELGTYIKKGAVGINILEPGDTYTRADGSSSVSYNVKKMFDISQTTLKEKQRSINYDDKTKLTALLKDCPVDIKAVDEIPNSLDSAKWDKDNNVMFVKRGAESQLIFKEIARELVGLGLEDTNSNELKDFKAKATAYMLCRKYDIDTSEFKITPIPECLKNMSSSEVRNELSSMRSSLEDINVRMNSYFESITKSQKNKDYER